MSDTNRRQVLVGALASGVVAGCVGPSAGTSGPNAGTNGFGRIEVYDDALARIVAPDTRIEVLASGFTWSEGPTWDRARDCLYFSDVPKNIAYRWSEGEGAVPFLTPSGIAAENAAGFREPGSNGLLWVSADEMLICNHGRRAIEAYDFSTGKRTTRIGQYKGLRFNSPNDLVLSPGGVLYFTDPPYGLEGLDASPLKEMQENGVYRLSTDRGVQRLLDDMSFPNGIGLSPDGRYLYISQSDPSDPYIRRLTLDDRGQPVDDIRWFDAGALLAAGDPGLPDGMVITASGHVFATGPGGVLILDPDGTLLGRLDLGQPTGNCTFGEDGKSLFVTSNDRLLRVRTKVSGLGWQG